ncbi:MAG: T9SS type A sorting domain-containing protein [candidate division WOR-3 bacterium]|nr:MAG: T9SS type A sorting domain-containing protein [candidate division WOR-3 bacterium]
MPYRRVLQLVAFATALLAVSAGAQPLPVVIIGDSLNEQATALVEAADSGYCLAGWTQSYGPAGVSNVLVVRTDPMGKPMWSDISIGQGNDEAYSMVRTHDNGYAITGWTESYGVGIPNRNIMVVKLTQAGAMSWGWAYGGQDHDEAYSIWETMDSGLVVAGYTFSYGPQPYPNILVMKLSAGGMFQWGRVYWCAPMHAADEALSIVQTLDTGYAVVGRANTTGPGQQDPFLLKLSQTGAVQWVNAAPGPPDQDEGHSVALDLKGNILAAGWTRSFGTNPTVKADIFVSQFSPTGMQNWTFTFGWDTDDELVLDDRSLVATQDTGSAVCGLTASVGPQAPPSPNFLVLKLDGNGALLWARSHPSPADTGLGLTEVALPMIQEGYGGYAIAGWSNSYPYLGGTADDDFHLLTLDQNGDRPVCVDSQVPELQSMPWLEVYMEDTVFRPSIESMPVVPESVEYHPICVLPGAKERGAGHRPVPAPGLAVPQNPVSPGVLSLAYVVPVPGRARVLVTDPLGRVVRSRSVLVERRGTVGIDLHGLHAGAYLVRLEAPGFSCTRKLVVQQK